MIHPLRECSCSGHNGKLASTRLVFNEVCSFLNSHWVTVPTLAQTSHYNVHSSTQVDCSL